MILSIFLTLFAVTLARDNYIAEEGPRYDIDMVERMRNVTTCSEFLHNTYLDVAELINKEWKVFYYWNVKFQKVTDDIVKFYQPSDMLIKRLKSMMNGVVSPPVDWGRAELHLENLANDHSLPSQESLTALLVRVNDTSGLYRVVPTTSFDFEYVESDYFLAMKLVDGYLGMMNCELRIVSALAPLDKLPTKDKVEEVAESFNIRSFEKWPYYTEPIDVLPPNYTDPGLAEIPDEEMPAAEVDSDPNNMQFI